MTAPICHSCLNFKAFLLTQHLAILSSAKLEFDPERVLIEIISKGG